MSNPMTPVEREYARKRCEAAIAGPWHLDVDVRKVAIYDSEDLGMLIAEVKLDPRDGEIDNDEVVANMRLLAHARTDLPRALSDIDALEAHVAELERERDRLSALLDERDSLLAATVKTGVQMLDKASAGLREALASAIDAVPDPAPDDPSPAQTMRAEIAAAVLALLPEAQVKGTPCEK